MKPLKRAMMRWSQGNFTGVVGSLHFTREHVFVEGIPACVRLRDFTPKPFIFVRSVMADSIQPELHFKGRRWVTISPPVSKTTPTGYMDDHFNSIPKRFAFLRSIEVRAAGPQWRKINMHEIFTVGETLRNLRRDAGRYGMFVTDLDHEDSTVLGAKFLLTGRVGAITLTKDDERHNLQAYKIHEDFADALLAKMKGEAFELHDLEAS